MVVLLEQQIINSLFILKNLQLWQRKEVYAVQTMQSHGSVDVAQ
jgi:hypothetical protein